MTDCIYTQVSDCRERRASRCGYCTPETANCCDYGMWAHSLTVTDYQDLINRNWRRSGKYCYQPQMKKTCCPQYMIRCDATQFKPTKNQKRVIKKFNRYMMTGSVCCDDSDTTEAERSLVGTPEHTDMNVSDPVTLTPAQPKKGVGADPTKPKAIKAKQLRLLRKQEKFQKNSNSIPEAGTERGASHRTKGVGGGGDIAGKTLAQLINEYDPANAMHKFEMRLVQSNPRSAEFEATVDEELIVYQKYQMAVHKTRVYMEQFRRFLIDSPLKAESRNGVTLGSFHYQYLLDGKIIAVEIMDILPQFISSKYFIYDPAYEFLTLGTYSTLRSIYNVQQLQEKLSSLRHYLMGYYIHSCQKMRYKGEFSSSYLLCPETYIWTPIEQCTPKLDVSKYSRFCADPNQEDVDKVDDSTLDNTVVLYDRQIMTYSQLSKSQTARSDKEEVQQYTRLVGRELSMRILLYRDY